MSDEADDPIGRLTPFPEKWIYESAIGGDEWAKAMYARPAGLTDEEWEAAQQSAEVAWQRTKRTAAIKIDPEQLFGNTE